MASVLGERNGTAPAMKEKKTVEETYQKKTQLEHILLRPDTYIGSVEKTTQTMMVVENDANGEPAFSNREVGFVPGLFKIFDEILVNAADHKIRDSSMDCIKINIDKESNTVSVYNNGRGIPVAMHSKEQVYVPELIFGHLLTSSNYDDKEKKVTGGRNGYGAKLCNIFSTEFVVETADSASGLTYRQVFRNNMTKREEPKIGKGKGEDWTRITFKPDLEKFGMTELDDDIVALMSRRAYDVAGTTKGVKVFLNNKRLPIKSFKDYVEMSLKTRGPMIAEPTLAHELVNDRWEVFVTLSDSGFQQTSFVNSIATTKGGTHVAYVIDQVVDKILDAVNKKNKAAPVKPFQVKGHLWVFVNCLIENPTFDSQTKENMTLKHKAFGSECNLSEKFVKAVVKSGVIESILASATARSQAQLAKATGGGKRARITGIAKLDDANEAGGRNSEQCTLILTEGDSAKALAVSGLSVVGRDFFGVFPLRGKLLNVREASHKQILENAEIKSIVQIVGLQYGKVYDSLKSLRYGKMMIMADQDQDGSHIKGLLINFIHHFWPSLLKLNDFLVEFVTPIVKCTKGARELSFFTLPQFRAWAETETTKGWRIKYYKGLGTSTPKEAKEYFASIDSHRIPFEYVDEHDDHDIELAFSKKKVEDRKEWLRGFEPGTFLDHSQRAISYSEFIHKELILFSMADNVRSIPSIVDGFKPGQRKVLFACFKRKLKDELKVAQLAGYVAEHSCYHHGEVSLAGTIVNMAQDYVGSNNINLLMPVGQFGTRLQGGKDAASPRYICTNVAALTRLLFVPDDDNLLTYLEDDGTSIEPEYYVPILPMVLVNGSEGIGTGWSSTVPTYNPVDIVNNLRALIRGEECTPMTPWFRGFTGEVIEKGKDKYLVKGVIEQVDDTTLKITELPIGVWTQTYKELLESMIAGTEKTPACIKDYKEYHTDTVVKFMVYMSEEQMKKALEAGLDKTFKLETSVSTSNMVLFDSNGRIKKYDTPEAILQEFYDLRLVYYQKRKEFLTGRLNEEHTRLDNKVRFIEAVINGTLVLSNRKRADLLGELKRRGFTPFPKAAKKIDTQADDNESVDGALDDGGVALGDYDYLLSMPLWSLTTEKVKKLTAERDAKAVELDILMSKKPADLWVEDLDSFSAQYALFLEQEAELAAASNKITAKSKALKKAAPKRAPKKKAAGSDDDGDFMDDDDSEDWSAPKKTTAKQTAAKPKATVVAAATAVAGAGAGAGTGAGAGVAKPIAKPAAVASKAVEKAPTAKTSTAAAIKPTAVVTKEAPKPKKRIARHSDSEASASEDDSASDQEWHSDASDSPKKATKKKAPAAKKNAMSDDEDVDNSDEMSETDTWVPKPSKSRSKVAAVDAIAPSTTTTVAQKTTQAPKSKPASKSTTAQVIVSDDEVESVAPMSNDVKPAPSKAKAPAKRTLDEFFEKNTAKTETDKPAAAAAKRKKLDRKVDSDNDSEDDIALKEEDESDDNYTESKSKPKAKPNPKPKSTTATTKAAPVAAKAKKATKADMDFEAIEEMLTYSPAKPATKIAATTTTAAKKVAAPKSAPATKATTAKSVAAPKPVAAPKTTKPKAKKADDDDDDEVAVEATTAPPREGRSRRAAAAKSKYVFDDEEDEDDDDIIEADSEPDFNAQSDDDE